VKVKESPTGLVLQESLVCVLFVSAADLVLKADLALPVTVAEVAEALVGKMIYQ